MFLAVPLVCIALYQAPTTPLTGIVIGPNGEPVAGAEVLLGGLPVYDQTVVARGRSDAQGRFTIERPTGPAGESRYITPVLWVVKPGFRLGSLRFPVPLPKPNEPVRVVLGPPGKGEVWVEDPNGRPAAGARIRLDWFGQERINVPEAVRDLIEATTDKDGRAVMEAAANDEIAYVDIHAKGFGIQGRPFRPLTSQPKRVRLRRVASLVRTGTDGTFRTPKDVYRKNREYRVEIIAAGFFNGKTGWESADGGERITFPDLVLRPHRAQRLIAGRVVDRGDKGLAAVTVFQPTDSPARVEAITDDAGRFRLDGVPRGPALLFAEKAGYRFGAKGPHRKKSL